MSKNLHERVKNSNIQSIFEIKSKQVSYFDEITQIQFKRFHPIILITLRTNKIPSSFNENKYTSSLNANQSENLTQIHSVLSKGGPKDWFLSESNTRTYPRARRIQLELTFHLTQSCRKQFCCRQHCAHIVSLRYNATVCQYLLPQKLRCMECWTRNSPRISATQVSRV